MRLSKVMWICLLAALVAFGNFSAFAIPVRQSSQNGQGTDVDSWTVLGRTVSIPLSANGKKVTMTRQIICAQSGDRVNGSCASGNYVYLFQVQSTSANVMINIGKLVKGSFTGDYFGVNICADTNTEELCTVDPDQSQLGGISFTATSKTAVKFTVTGAFPSFPAGTAEEGQGLTFYIITHQTSPLPIAFLSIGVN